MGTPQAASTPNTSITYTMTEGGLNPTEIAGATIGAFEQASVGYVSDAIFGTNTLILEVIGLDKSIWELLSVAHCHLEET